METSIEPQWTPKEVDSNMAPKSLHNTRVNYMQLGHWTTSSANRNALDHSQRQDSYGHVQSGIVSLYGFKVKYIELGESKTSEAHKHDLLIIIHYVPSPNEVEASVVLIDSSTLIYLSSVPSIFMNH